MSWINTGAEELADRWTSDELGPFSGALGIGRCEWVNEQTQDAYLLAAVG